MAQFDVFPNPSKKTGKLFPYLLDIQSPLISDIATRIVLPLGNLSDFKNEHMKKLTPIIEYNGLQLILLTPQMSAVPTNILRCPVGSLEHFRDEIIASIDFAITGI